MGSKVEEIEAGSLRHSWPCHWTQDTCRFLELQRRKDFHKEDQNIIWQSIILGLTGGQIIKVGWDIKDKLWVDE